MMVGLFFSFKPSSMASEMAWRLWSPSSTCKTCHPYDKKRCSTFSVKATAVSPSIEISVGGVSRVRLRMISLTVIVVNLGIPSVQKNET
jgi:hypothetical protein